MLEILGMLVLAAILITVARLVLRPWAFVAFAVVLLLILVLPSILSLVRR